MTTQTLWAFERVAEGLNVDCEVLEQLTQQQLYPGASDDERREAPIIATRALMEKHPDYSTLAARLLLEQIEEDVPHSFEEAIHLGIKRERLDPKLAEFDLPTLAAALRPENDQLFGYLGLQTLNSRYLLPKIERPQYFWMRVAMGLSLLEANKEQRAIEFYELLSRLDFVSSTPTLFNAGTLHPQLSSCYLSTVEDTLKGIFKLYSDDAQLSKWAGGLGNDWTPVRASGAYIKGTHGKSQGIIPFLKIANDTALAVNQGGKRKGAMCAYLEVWHLDIEEFIELRKNTGDERRRTHDMNTAAWIPDLFMKRLEEGGTWTLFSPSDVPDLHDLYGEAFEKRYAKYERLAQEGSITLFKVIKAQTLWRKMLSMLFETGHPWITFKDPANERSMQDHQGVVHCSNLCTEILLNTSKEETAVCNLGSVNLANHVSPEGIDYIHLKQTIQTAVRMLDNVIDLNFYPIPEAGNANRRHRPIGLGVMGFQDALYAQQISYASEQAISFADKSQEAIAYYAYEASADLAEEKGAYPTFNGSKWSKGMLPHETAKEQSSSMDWERVRQKTARGMRNSHVLAIAPTATIGNIAGVTPSIEPTYKHLYVKSNLGGEFTLLNRQLIEALGPLWDEEMIEDLKHFDGSLAEIDRVPEKIKTLFQTAFEIEPRWLVACAAKRQKWIDMGQSLNLYFANPNGKLLDETYRMAWKQGLKTTYYARTLAATTIEKSTLDVNKRGVQPRWMQAKSCSANIDVERCEVCQ